MGERLLRNDWFEVGTRVATIFYDDGDPKYATCVVKAVEPLALACEDPAASELEPGRKVMLVLKDGGFFAKAETKIRAVRKEADSWVLFPDSHAWELLDQRRFPRYRVTAPVHLRSIHESVQGPEIIDIDGATVDLSVGGAWVDSPAAPPIGSLVDFRVELGQNGWVKILAMVARTSEGRTGFAVEFLDFIGGARFALHSFLERAA